MQKISRSIGAADKKKAALFLLGSSAAALLWANSPWHATYETFWNLDLAGLSIRNWVNEGLMSLFFFLVGLELKRELFHGELSTPKKALLPLLAAVGGMLIPALIYLFINGGTPARVGWGIPMATDIAFALGALAFCSKRVPASLRVFLTALAVIDDLGSILVIAIYYTENLSFLSLAAAFLWTTLLGIHTRTKPKNTGLSILLTLALWLSFLKSGIQPTLTGVLVASLLPIQSATAGRLERLFEPWVNSTVLPLFALANTGISLWHGPSIQFLHPVCLGVLCGLALGKPIGISLAAFLSIQSGLAHRPKSSSWRQILGVSCLAGIGFTVSIFMAQLAFSDSRLLAEAKVGIISASLIAFTLGCWLTSRSECTIPE